MLLDDFRRIRRGEPCPVCDHLEWCLVSRDEPPSRVICQRVESKRRWGEAGWLHVLRDDGRSRPRARHIVIPRHSPPRDFSGPAAEYRERARPDAVARFAEDLGVTCDSLERLGVGWDGRNWTFPMVDASGFVRGIRLRTPSGRKFAVTGSREGLFVPSGLCVHDPLLVCEGPTDTAAALTLRFDAVGRPCGGSGVRLVVEYVKRHCPPTVVVVADTDAIGLKSATNLAAVLACYCRDVRLIEPRAKDLRAWLQAGATAADVNEAIARAEQVRVRLRRCGGVA